MTIDEKKLSDVLNIEYVEEEVEEITTNLSNDKTPTEILFDNIDRANNLLDIIEHEIDTGNMSARMAEVAGQLINSVTGTTSQIMTDKYNTNYLKIRENIVKIKEYEVKLKAQGLGAQGGNRELIIATREDVLKILQEKDKKQIEEAIVK